MLRNVHLHNPGYGFEVGNKINIFTYGDDTARIARNEKDLKKLTETLVIEAKK